MKLLFKILSLTAALFMTGCSTKAHKAEIEVVSPTEFQSKISDATGNAYLLDVRTPEEFATGHLDGAHMINWFDTDKFKQEAMNIDKSQTVYVYCRSGRRSNEAANYLAEQGYTVIDMDGGIQAWEQDGLPVTTDNVTD